MKLPRTSSVALVALLCAGPAQAQFHINEILVSHDFSDTMEFAEIVGAPGASLDGIMLLTLEGDGNLKGQLDHAWDLSGYSVPADGLFVVGTAMTANVDFVTAAQDSFDNGTQTVYVIWAAQPQVIISLIGSDMDADDDLITDLALDPNVVLLEVIGLADSQIATFDEIYDCAPHIGPNGTALPAGAFRPDDFPLPFCSDEYPDFFYTGSATSPAPSPGLPNSSSLTGCTRISASLGCGAQIDLGTSYCTPALPNSTGLPASISAFGSPLPPTNDVTLTAEGLPPGQFGYFLVGATQGLFNPPGSSGLICLTGAIGRYNQPANIGQGPSFSIALDTQALPLSPAVAIQPGETWNFQTWYRDFSGTTSNFTDAVAILFL